MMERLEYIQIETGPEPWEGEIMVLDDDLSDSENLFYWSHDAYAMPGPYISTWNKNYRNKVISMILKELKNIDVNISIDDLQIKEIASGQVGEVKK